MFLTDFKKGKQLLTAVISTTRLYYTNPEPNYCRTNHAKNIFIVKIRPKMVKLGSKEHYVWPWRALVVLLCFPQTNPFMVTTLTAFKPNHLRFFWKKSLRLATFFNLFLVSSQKNVNRTKKWPKSPPWSKMGEKKERTFFYRLLLSVFIFIFVFMSFFFDA